MDFIIELQQKLSNCVEQVLDETTSNLRASSLGEMEQAVRQTMHQLGNEIIASWLYAADEKYPADESRCECGEQAHYERKRAGKIITLQGRVTYRRACYRCPSCGKGHHPLDDQLGIKPGEMSEEVIKLAALQGIQTGFEASSDLLTRTTLLELSPNSIRKACQKVGQSVVAQEVEQIETSQKLAEQLVQKQKTGPKRLYGSLDGFHGPFRDGWHEVKGGVWWQVDEQGRPYNKTYYADTCQAADLSELVWATGFARQADQAEELIFVADGADWIWRLVDEHFSQAVQIVDWYHASAYLPPVAESAFPDETQRQDWLEQTKAALWAGDLNTVIAACQEHIRPQLAVDDDPAQKAVRYFTNHRHRMDYASFRAKGYQIGSGTMESACKQLGVGRLKITGARWLKTGGRLVTKARTAYLSGQWDQLKIA